MMKSKELASTTDLYFFLVQWRSFPPKLPSKSHGQVSQPSYYQLCNVKLILKRDINEKTTSKSQHSTPALITKPTDPLLPQLTILLAASITFKVQRVKDTSVHLSQTKGEVYGTTAWIAASEATAALITRMRKKLQQQLQFLKWFPVSACWLLTGEETADGHTKTGSQTKLLLQKSPCGNTSPPGLLFKAPDSSVDLGEDLIASWCEGMSQLMSSGCKSSN